MGLNSRVISLQYLNFFCVPIILTISTLLYFGWISGGFADPSITVPGFKVEKVVDGLNFPTTMAFINDHDFLILEKNNGTVRLVTNGSLLPDPLLDLNVSIGEGRGMWGITEKSTKKHTYIFLTFLESSQGNDTDDLSEGKAPKGNVVYRYELIEGRLNDIPRLVNPVLLDSLPGRPGPFHYGGIIVVGPDGDIYHGVGDTGPPLGIRSTAQNIQDGIFPNGTSSITRFDEDGNRIGDGILGDKPPLDKYFAYGIRNIFGLSFDPVTGNLWDTENGPEYGDELNLVVPGFNSGWRFVQGKASEYYHKFDQALGIDNLANSSLSSMLVNFSGKGIYRDPEFTWDQTVGITAVTFLDSGKYGKDLENDLFVSDFVNGNIYHFDLNKKRNHLLLNGSLADDRANAPSELEPLIFGTGFGGITDLKVGPDGYLYIVSHIGGTVYRILPM